MFNVYELKVDEYYKPIEYATDDIIRWQPDEVYTLGFYSSKKKAMAAFVAMIDGELEWNLHWVYDTKVKVPEINIEKLMVRIEIGEEMTLFTGTIEKHKVN